MFIVTKLYDLLTSNENTGPTGANAVRTAVQELQDITDGDFSATLGEPDLLPRGGQFFNDPKVIVPVEDGPFGETQRLVFDLPAGEVGGQQFNELLEIVGVTFETMENIAGTEVPVSFVAGNLVVNWDLMDGPDDGDKGAADNPHTDEDVQDVLEEDTPEERSLEKVPEEEVPEEEDQSVTESVVQSEEKTISADD